ncbi:MAG: Bax inhibitor-1/YccA family protein [Bacilli bacterium]|jgi:FtsH-binding integral membrane protein|nr:Bax inhibitor-1/YccA family protein [Bacilli bacterium]
MENENKLIPKVLLWMTLGLFVTFATGYVVSLNDTMLLNIFTSGFYWVFIIAELILVIVLSARITKMKGTTAKICFILYAFISGLTFSSIFIVYELMSIFYVFLIAAIVFAIFAAIGYFTDLDLTNIGSLLLMGLVAVVICMIMNIFIGSEKFNLVLSIISIAIFIGFTAYDIQKIKRLENSGLPEENLAIYGALELYLDFINIFLDLLKLIGESKD